MQLLSRDELRKQWERKTVWEHFLVSFHWRNQFSYVKKHHLPGLSCKLRTFLHKSICIVEYFQHNTLHIRLSKYSGSKLKVTLWCSLGSQETRKLKWQREGSPWKQLLFYDIFFIKTWSKITRYLLNRCCHCVEHYRPSDRNKDAVKTREIFVDSSAYCKAIKGWQKTQIVSAEDLGGKIS